MDLCFNMHLNNGQFFVIGGEDLITLYGENIEQISTFEGYDVHRGYSEYKKILQHLLSKGYVGINIKEDDNKINFGGRAIIKSDEELLIKNDFINSIILY